MQKKKGISLIVLVITIIVMIVLAGAIILSLNNAGIIEKANQAVKDTDEATVKELVQMAWAEAYADGVRHVEDIYVNDKKIEGFNTRVNAVLDKNVPDKDKYIITITEKGTDVNLGWKQVGLKLTRGKEELTIGQTINYTATGTDYTGEWKVLGADEKGNLLIMSDADVATDFSLYTEATTLATAQSTWLSGGVNKLNTECEKYGKGTGAIGARSITVEDIDKVVGYDPANVDGKGTPYASTSIYAYRNEVTYTYNGTIKPTYIGVNNVTANLITDHTIGFYWYDKEGFHNVTATELINEENEGKEIVKVTSTYYGYAGTVGTNKLTLDSTAYKMLFGTSGGWNYYWLASPYVYASTSILGFGMRRINEGSVSNNSLWSSSGYAKNPTGGVRAVVILNSNIPMASLTK